jgi:hypothetical protein
MAVSLRTFLNRKLKEKGITSAQAKKNAGKYSSIAAAKKAGSLYYTNKDGKVMAAVYAEDLKKAPETSLRPKSRPKKKVGPAQGPTRRGVMTLDEKMEVDKANKKPMSPAALRKMVETAISKAPTTVAPKNKSQSTRFNTWFRKNQKKYERPNGGFNMGKAIKDFSQTQLYNK